MNKPHWDDAPRWARWLAQDSDGEWFWYEKTPCLPIGSAVWIVDGRYKLARKTLNYEAFGLTLERRP